MRIRLGAGLLLVIGSIVLNAGAGGPGEAQPSGAAVDRAVVDIAGAEEPNTPAIYNRAVAFRYFTSETPTPTTVLVLIPGLNSGPNTLDILARQLVEREPRLEVWIVAPRATLLQDRRGVEAALAYGNPDFALGYYYGGLPVDNHTYYPLSSTAVAYAAYWGLDVHLRDVHAIVTEAHRRYPGARVVLGGHSLGGILTALYAGYDFDRLPGPEPVALAQGVPAQSPGAGARDLSGLLLLDGVPLALIPRLTGGQYLDGVRIPLLPRIPGVRALVRRLASPFADVEELARPQDSIMLDVIAVYAYLQPDAPSRLPFPPRDGLAITNEALLGGILSDQTQPDQLVRASVGAPLGIFKRISDPASINPDGLLDLSHGRPAPGHALIEWIPYTRSVPRGRVDLRELATAMLRPGADFTQWYVPWRLVLDLGLAARLDTSDEFARRYASLTQVRYTAIPVLILGAGDGLIRRPQVAAFYLRHIATPPTDARVEILPGFTHLDIEDAVDNPAVARILAWLDDMLH
ncbi:MAG TPA: hypothetical protein VEP50_00615 [bacterium]|nr:hypothetical protein [bacterium]